VNNPGLELLLQKARDAKPDGPCWCGSDLPFDTCHKDREQQSAITIQTIIKRVEATMSKHRRGCLHFDAPGECSPDFVRSHTIQRAALELISEDAHVLGFVPSIPELLQGRHLPQRLGLKVASTMTAFCRKHDNELFVPLEKVPFTATAEQLLLLSYRALCRQVFANEWMRDHQLRVMREMDRGLTLEQQVAFQVELGFQRIGAAAGTQLFRDTKTEFDGKLRERDRSGLRFVAVELDDTPTVASSTSRVPAGDFAANARPGFSALEDLIPINFSLIPGVDSGVAVFGWLGRSPANEHFAISLDRIGDGEVPDALIRFAFTYAENTFISPPWWRGLSAQTADALVARMGTRPTVASLHDDGVRAAAWPIRRRFSGLT
jgi:hypothetical protein